MSQGRSSKGLGGQGAGPAILGGASCPGQGAERLEARGGAEKSSGWQSLRLQGREGTRRYRAKAVGGGAARRGWGVRRP